MASPRDATPSHEPAAGASPERRREADALFEAALERDEAEREAFVRESASDDPWLLAEVLSLLAMEPEAREALGEVVWEFAPELWGGPELWEGPEAEGGPEVRAVPGIGLSPGDRVGPYRLGEELGRGGMGIVFEAVDERLGRTVALKCLPPWSSGDPEAKERFINEARAASASDHPNIATLYEVEETPEGRLYLAMARYEGRTLKERLAEGPLAPPEAASVACQVAAALAAAHRRGVVHRDVKPANVFLAEDGWVKVLDFGVAKVRDADLTAPGARLGTVAYMSPEQGRGEPVDGRSDLWSLGVVLYEMLTGGRPFRGEGNAAVLRAILEEDPPPVTEAVPGVPAGLERIVARLLVKEPEGRYSTAGEVQAALVAFLEAADEPTPPSIRRRTGFLPPPSWRGPRRGRPAVAVAAGLLVVLGVWAASGAGEDDRRGAGTAGAAVLGVEPREDHVAVFPFTVRGDREFAYLGQGMVDLLSVELDGAGSLTAVDPATLLVALERDPAARSDPARARDVAARLAAGSFVMGTVVEVGGRLQVQASFYGSDGRVRAVARSNADDETELFAVIEDLARQLLLGARIGEEDRRARLAAMTSRSIPALKRYLRGEQALRAGRYGDAVGAFLQATEIDSTFALAHLRLAVAAGWARREGVAREAADRAERFGARLEGSHRLLLDVAMAWRRGDGDDAERLYQRILQRQPGNVHAWYELGDILYHYNPLRGRSFLESAVPFRQAILLDPGRSEALAHLMDLAAWEGHWPRFDSLFRRMDPEADLWRVYRAVEAHGRGDPAERARAREALAGADPGLVRAAVERVALLTRDLEGAGALAALLGGSDRPVGWRAVGHLDAALLEAGSGRWTRARRSLDSAAVHAPVPALLLRGLLAAEGFLRVPDPDLEGVREALLRWDPAVDPRWAVASNPVLSIHDRLHPQLRHYLLGRIEARLGNTIAVREHAAALEATADPPVADSLSRDLARSLRSHVAALEGDPDGALGLLLGSRVQRRYDLVMGSPFYNQAHERWRRAELLGELGRHGEALDAYGAVREAYLEGVLYRAPAELRRAEILVRLGRTGEARTAYRRFLELWRRADPALRPVVEEARRRLEDLPTE